MTESIRELLDPKNTAEKTGAEILHDAAQLGVELSQKVPLDELDRVRIQDTVKGLTEIKSKDDDERIAIVDMLAALDKLS